MDPRQQIILAPRELRELVAGTGTPLRIALDKSVGVKRVGQIVTGTLIESLTPTIARLSLLGRLSSDTSGRSRIRRNWHGFARGQVGTSRRSVIVVIQFNSIPSAAMERWCRSRCHWA
jgi:hypothetical protein